MASESHTELLRRSTGYDAPARQAFQHLVAAWAEPPVRYAHVVLRDRPDWVGEAVQQR